MEITPLTNVDALKAHLEQQRNQRLYEYGDLDPLYFNQTEYFGIHNGTSAIEALGLIFTPPSPKVLLLTGTTAGDIRLAAQVHTYSEIIDNEYEVHLSEESAAALELSGWRLRNCTPHYRMILPKQSLENLEESLLDHPKVCMLTFDDANEVATFLDRIYDGNSFAPEMLLTAPGIGVRNEAGQLVAVAGAHIMAATMNCAALGNIAVDPAERGKGLGGIVVGALLIQLRKLGIETIGLNVAVENKHAIRLYEKHGFEVCTKYMEGYAVVPSPSDANAIIQVQDN